VAAPAAPATKDSPPSTEKRWQKKMCLLTVLANPLTRILLQARAIIESAQQERKFHVVDI
jgi:hypothetical protein